MIERDKERSEALKIWVKWVGREPATEIAKRIREGTKLPADTKFLLLQHTFQEMTKTYWVRAMNAVAGKDDAEGLKHTVRQEHEWMTDDAHEAFWWLLMAWAAKG